MHIQLYYNKPKDCIQYVVDGVLTCQNEYVHNGEYFNYFGAGYIEDLEYLETETIIQGYKDIMGDLEYFIPREEIEEYHSIIKSNNIIGELIHEVFL